MLLVINNMREQCLSGARLVSLFPPDGTLERSTDVPEMEEILGLSKDDNDDGGDDDDDDDDIDDGGDEMMINLSPVKEDKRGLSFQRLPKLPFRSSLCGCSFERDDDDKIENRDSCTECFF